MSFVIRSTRGDARFQAQRFPSRADAEAALRAYAGPLASSLSCDGGTVYLDADETTVEAEDAAARAAWAVEVRR